MSKNEIRCCGLDCGTGNLASCEQSKEDPKKIEFRKIRDCFYKIDPANFMGGANPQFAENMLKQQKAHYVKVGPDIYILGDSAQKFATALHKETLRPMKNGILNPKEPVSALMVGEIIKALAKKAESPTDVIYYCIPSNPIDADFDNEYHKETLKQVFVDLGYQNINCIEEGLAVVFSELSKDNFTGIGISFGAGMVNVCYSMMGMPLLSFSISRSGDWIDLNASQQTGETRAVINHKKEKGKDGKGMDITNPQDDYEKAIAVYYRALLKYLVENIKKLYLEKKDTLPVILDPMPVIVAGGTSLVGGFIPTFEEIFRKGVGDLIPISVIKHAEDPMYSVAHGLYSAAKLNSGS